MNECVFSTQKIDTSKFDDVLKPQRRILLAKAFMFVLIVDYITDYSLTLDIFKKFQQGHHCNSVV